MYPENLQTIRQCSNSALVTFYHALCLVHNLRLIFFILRLPLLELVTWFAWPEIYEWSINIWKIPSLNYLFYILGLKFTGDLSIVITWPSEWKSYDNYQPKLYLIWFDFYYSAWFFLIYATEWQRLVLPHLRYRVGSMSTYKLEEYSVRRVSDMTRWQRGAKEWWQRPRRMMMNAV